MQSQENHRFTQVQHSVESVPLTLYSLVAESLKVHFRVDFRNEFKDGLQAYLQGVVFR